MPAILHAYKVHRPEVEGGIPAVIETIATGLGPPFSHRILVARRRGGSARDRVFGTEVQRVASLGTLFSLPLAPGYPMTLAGAAARADVVALHAPFPLGDLGLALRDGPPVVVHWHAEIARQRRLAPLYAPLMRRTLQRAASIVVAHERVADASEQLHDFAPKLRVVPYGLDPRAWVDLDDEDRDEISRLGSHPEPLFVAVGRLVSYKGFDILVRAATQVPARVIICGVGADDARLRRMAGSLGVSDRVSFEGSASTRRLRQLLHAARASVLPSITSAEAFGLVQVEAMFCGTAMINTDLPTAVPWVARDGHEAITVPPGDAEALAGAMRRLAGNADLARRLGAAGRRRAHGLFSAEVFCRSLGRVYREALASGSPSGCA